MEGEVLIDVLMLVFALLLILVGWLVRDHHSEYPDTFCGYHVGGIAAKSGDAWEDANRWCGEALLKSGAVLLLLNLAAAFCFHALKTMQTYPLLTVAYLMLIVIEPTVLAIGLTEHRLKEKYNRDGTRNKENRR